VPFENYPNNLCSGALSSFVKFVLFLISFYRPLNILHRIVKMRLDSERPQCRVKWEWRWLVLGSMLLRHLVPLHTTILVAVVILVTNFTSETYVSHVLCTYLLSFTIPIRSCRTRRDGKISKIFSELLAISSALTSTSVQMVVRRVLELLSLRHQRTLQMRSVGPGLNLNRRPDAFGQICIMDLTGTDALSKFARYDLSPVPIRQLVDRPVGSVCWPHRSDALPG
jgi:hypothetical protein